MTAKPNGRGTTFLTWPDNAQVRICNCDLPRQYSVTRRILETTRSYTLEDIDNLKKQSKEYKVSGHSTSVDDDEDGSGSDVDGESSMKGSFPGRDAPQSFAGLRGGANGSHQEPVSK